MVERSYFILGGYKNILNKDVGVILGYCKICNTLLSTHKTELNRHSQSSKHIKLSKYIAQNTSLVQILECTSSRVNGKRAELLLAGLIASQNLPFSLMDTLVPLIIAEKLNLKRTKTTQTVKKALGSTFLELLCQKLRDVFPLIMD